MAIIDDCSYQSKILMKLCEHYDAYFLSGNERLGHLQGDLQAHRLGLEWAKYLGLEYLVKISRRCVPLFDWTGAFIKTVEDTGHLPTYAGTDNYFMYPLRSECWAMNVEEWYPIKDEILGVAKEAAEYTLHRHAVRLGNIGPDWGLCAENRRVRKEGVLWHENTTLEEYAAAANQFGLKYTAEDFDNVNGGLGLGNEKWRHSVPGSVLPCPGKETRPEQTIRKLEQNRVGQNISVPKAKKSKRIETWPPVKERIIIPKSTRRGEEAPIPQPRPSTGATVKPINTDYIHGD